MAALGAVETVRLELPAAVCIDVWSADTETVCAQCVLPVCAHKVQAPPGSNNTAESVIFFYGCHGCVRAVPVCGEWKADTPLLQAGQGEFGLKTCAKGPSINACLPAFCRPHAKLWLMHA